MSTGLSRRLLPALILIGVGTASTFAQSWTLRGIVEPCQDAKVSASVGGIVVAIRAKEGQFVRAGEIVVELDSALEALEVERRKLVAESTAELDAARSRMETLSTDLEGTRKLWEQTRSVSQDDLAKKELEFRIAVAERDRLLVSEERERLEWKLAEAQLQRRFIAAPFDGVIVERLLEVGEGCSEQQALFRIVDTRTCRLVVHMEQGQALKMKPGGKVAVRVQEADGPVITSGIVEFVSPLVDPASGLREVKVLFDNPDGRIHPGVTGAVGMER